MLAFKQLLLDEASRHPQGIGFIVLTAPNDGGAKPELDEKTRELVSRYGRQTMEEVFLDIARGTFAGDEAAEGIGRPER